MKNKVGSVVITGVYGNMGDVPGRNVFENDERPDRDILTGDKIIAVRILTEADAACRTGTDLSIRSGVICRCGTQIIRAGCTAGVNARNVR